MSDPIDGVGGKMTKWSIIVGMLGILATRIAITRLSPRTTRRISQRCWLLGLASLFPAWLISFTALLGNPGGEAYEASLPRPVILSSSAALLGVIVSDFLQRRLESSGGSHPIMTYWILGAASLVPAWCIALLSLGEN